MEDVKPIGADVTGFEILTNAVLSLLNQFPGLNGREILFEEMGKDSGLAFSADNGALIITERRSIIDHVRQECQYPFYIVYRTASIEEYQMLNETGIFDAFIVYETASLFCGTATGEVIPWEKTKTLLPKLKELAEKK